MDSGWYLNNAPPHRDNSAVRFAISAARARSFDFANGYLARNLHKPLEATATAFSRVMTQEDYMWISLQLQPTWGEAISRFRYLTCLSAMLRNDACSVCDCLCCSISKSEPRHAAAAKICLMPEIKRCSLQVSMWISDCKAATFPLVSA